MEFTQAVRKVSESLARSFVFGSYTYEDICQEICVYSLEALEDYDNQRSLENFLYVHCLKRLINLKRNKFWRAEPACKACGAGKHCEPGGCAKHTGWLKINSSKASLANSSNSSEYNEHSNEDKNVYDNDFYELIGMRLPANLRESYLKLKDGVLIKDSDRDKIAQILEVLYA